MMIMKISHVDELNSLNYVSLYNLVIRHIMSVSKLEKTQGTTRGGSQADLG